jgi:hypothetical protein
MKKLNLILVMMLLISSNVFSQWNTGGNTWNAYGATDWNLLGTNNIRSIGIGHKQMFGGFIEGWTTGNPPKAALHINAHYLSNSPAFTPGHMFRTDGPANQDNMWQLFTGNNYGNSTEKARLYIPAESDHFSLQSSTGDMRFHTGGLTQRMRILGSNGFVAIGQNFNNPLSLLSVDGSDDNTGEVFRTNTGDVYNTFWRMEINNNEMGSIFSRRIGAPQIDLENFNIQASQKDITFHTRPLFNGIGEERMRIVGESHNFGLSGGIVRTGNVGIGNSNPLTMLHIGDSFTILTMGCWRDWMDIGTYYGMDNDGMYVGLVEAPGPAHHDAVINWGNNPTTQPYASDHLRFIFTAQESLGLPASTMEYGLEVARMVSDGTDGRMGIGDFNTLGEEPSHTLDILGNARIREVPQGDFDSVLVINGDGVLHWTSDVGPGAALGNICGNTPNNLDDNWEIPLDGNNFVFSGYGPIGTNGVGIGIDDCTPDAKLEVYMDSPEMNSLVTGIKSVTESNLFNPDNNVGIGVHGLAQHNSINVGILGEAKYSEQLFSLNGLNYGGYFQANHGGINYGIYSSVPNTASNNFAGFFDGNVNVDGDLTIFGVPVTPSDEQFKENITDYSGALEKVRNLNPVTFNYDTADYDLNFPVGLQYGLISNDVEQVIPELVSNGVIPPEVDSAGNIITDSISYKGLNYLELTPILTQAVKEIDDTIQEIVAKPDIPVLISPENNDTILAKEIPEFVWHQADHAQFYTLYLSYTADMSDVFQSVTTMDTVSNVYIGTKNDTTVYWAVKAYNNFGESDYSEIRHVFCAYGFDDKKAESYSTLSDANMKTNINPIDDALEKTLQLNGISFEWDTEQSPDRNLSEGTKLGIIAQEIQPLFPEVVQTDQNGFLYIDYTSLVPVLVEAMKEQQTQIDNLQQQIDNLASVVDDCCGDNDKGSSNDTGENNNPAFSQDVKLNNQQAIVLNQNVPNPFKEQTTISFQVPETVKEARIVFIDNAGSVLKQVKIQERGTGELIVYGQDLSAGMYSYYLVADGKTIASKKMVVSGR